MEPKRHADDALVGIEGLCPFRGALSGAFLSGRGFPGRQGPGQFFRAVLKGDGVEVRAGGPEGFRQGVFLELWATGVSGWHRITSSWQLRLALHFLLARRPLASVTQDFGCFSFSLYTLLIVGWGDEGTPTSPPPSLVEGRFFQADLLTAPRAFARKRS
jgi:hypothetical protein